VATEARKETKPECLGGKRLRKGAGKRYHTEGGKRSAQHSSGNEPLTVGKVRQSFVVGLASGGNAIRIGVEPKGWK